MPYTQGQVKRFAILTKNFQKCKQLTTKHSAVCKLGHRRLNVNKIPNQVGKDYSSMSFLFSSYSEYVPSKK